MNDEIAQAFDHPEHRAKACSDGAPDVFLDRISLRDHIVTVEIGAFQVERNVTQRLSFNVVVEVAKIPEPLDDDVDNILSYDRVTEAIAFELAAERLNLLETLAERIATRILSEPQAVRVFVRIEKLDRGPGALGVEIVRARGLEDSVSGASGQGPLVVFLSDAALADARLAALISQLDESASPVLLTLGPGANQPIPSPDSVANFHIDLLAIEQNAWALAGADARLRVVETRTELDWALKNGQMSVWAPSKLILSAVDVAIQTADPIALAVWIATETNAAEIIVVGDFAGKVQTKIPLRVLELGAEI